jgi:geranylgeranyl reductase family protein
MSKGYDVIIVGAGPAGCSAATFLGRGGYRVLLVDKAKFPRDKVCGDGISPAALEVLDRMGVRQRIAEKNPWKIDGIDISSPEGNVVRAAFSHSQRLMDHGYVMPREVLDLVLFQHVREISTVDVIEDCNVRDLISNGKTTCGVRVGHGKFPNAFNGKVIVGADGVYSIVAQRIYLASTVPRQMAFGVRAYFDHVEGLDKYAELHFDQSVLPGYLWVFPTSEDSANVGLGGSWRALGKENIRKRFNELTQRNKFLEEKLKRARIVGESLRGWPITLGSRFSRRSHKNILLIGDAGGFADPLTGEGIYHALKSGECAAKAINKAFSDGRDINRTADIYEKLWKRAFSRREYLTGYLLQRFIIKKSFLNLNVRRANARPSMARTLAAILCHKKSKIRLIF